MQLVLSSHWHLEIQKSFLHDKVWPACREVWFYGRAGSVIFIQKWHLSSRKWPTTQIIISAIRVTLVLVETRWYIHDSSESNSHIWPVVWFIPKTRALAGGGTSQIARGRSKNSKRKTCTYHTLGYLSVTLILYEVLPSAAALKSATFIRSLKYLGIGFLIWAARLAIL